MKKKILITGASGFIGTALMRNLVDTDWEIIPLVRRSIGLKNEVIVDFCGSDFRSKIHSLPEVDVVLHLGAMVSFNDNLKEDLFTPNVLATGELVSWARKMKAYFVFASTVMVCGVKNSYITKDSNPVLDSAYGYSKWLAEEMVIMSGIKSAVLRIAGVFGKGGPFHLGINKAIDGALNGIIPVQYGDGDIKRNYIYVEDLCKIIKFCMENNIEGRHLVAGAYINTMHEMLQIICDIMLPGKSLQCSKGRRGYDQIIERSTCLPRPQSFEGAIEGIKRDEEQAFL